VILHSSLAAELAREHRRRLLAEVSQRQLGKRATRTTNPAGTIIRRAATAIAGAGVTAPQSLGAIALAGTRQLRKPASEPASPGHSH
jgi:hypothetical protein